MAVHCTKCMEENVCMQIIVISNRADRWSGMLHLEAIVRAWVQLKPEYNVGMIRNLYNWGVCLELDKFAHIKELAFFAFEWLNTDV